MAIVSFTSLKGGVGKTTLSMNVAHAFAQRGCEVIVIDLDPSAHASRLLLREGRKKDIATVSPLARLLLTPELQGAVGDASLLEAAMHLGVNLFSPVRERLDLIPASNDLRHLVWGRGSRLFSSYFGKLIDELSQNYDYIIIDTPPDFNVLTRNAIAQSSMVVVPVDGSEMSIHCLEEIAGQAAHIKGPLWGIVRTLVSRSASRIQELSERRLRDSLELDIRHEDEFAKADETGDDHEEFISLLKERENGESAQSGPEQNDSPIYLLNSMVYRTEVQNRLTFSGKTSFDLKGTKGLSKLYLSVAKEIEELLCLSESEEAAEDVGSFGNIFTRQYEDAQEACFGAR